MIKIIFVLLISLSFAEDKLDTFRKLSELNERWLRSIAVPELAFVLHRPPYSYHSNFLKGQSELLAKSHSYSDTGRNRSCSDDLVQVLFNIKSEWALQMLDSDGKLSSGLLRGGLIWPGHFTECTSVYAPRDNEGHGDFHGRYCVTSWKMDLGGQYSNLPLSVGICVPDSCTADMLKTAGQNLGHILNRYPVLNELSKVITLTDVTCKATDKQLDTASIVYLSIVSLFVLFLVLGSFLSVTFVREKFKIQNSTEIRQQTTVQNEAKKVRFSDCNGHGSFHEKSETQISEGDSEAAATHDKAALTQNVEITVPNCEEERKTSKASGVVSFLSCFSAFENGAKILNTDRTEGQLLSIHGIRVLSLIWVILGHTYITSVPIIGNKLDVLSEMDSFQFQVLLQSPFSVDSFFLLSGFLLTYLFLKEADKKKGKINWIYFYVHRFWRLTPAYLVIVFFYLFVFKFMGSGPFWDDQHCEANLNTWWMYILYINNFIPIHRMCVGWSWYLANDMQFYFISPLFLYPLWRRPKIGFSILILMLLGTWITTGVMSYQYEIIPMFVGVTEAKDFNAYEEKMWNSFDLIYDKPYTRIAPYLIGVILGFMLQRLNQRKNFLNWWQQTLGWLLGSFFALSVIYGLYHVTMGRTTSLFYNALCRSSFSLGLAWVIFACETGHGGFVSRLLSWKFFLPLSRLTYCAYLIHPMLIHAYYYSYKTAFYFTEYAMVTNFLGFTVMAYGGAFIYSLAFESPFMNLEKLLLKKKS